MIKYTHFFVYFVKKSQNIVKIGIKCAFFAFILTGCVKNVDPVDTIATAAHQQIIAIRESLPPECNTSVIDKQLNAHDATVDSIVSTCESQKSALDSERLRWKWAFIGLVVGIGLYFAIKILR